jgi:saccharopine dehydrogenase-like NADP-dependent oxidoreductase
MRVCHGKHSQVVIASRNFDKLKAAAEELKGKLKSDSVFPVACNIRKEDEVRRRLLGNLSVRNDALLALLRLFI